MQSPNRKTSVLSARGTARDRCSLKKHPAISKNGVRTQGHDPQPGSWRVVCRTAPKVLATVCPRVYGPKRRGSLGMPRGTVKAFTRRPACLGSRAFATAGNGNRFHACSNLNTLILHENNGLYTYMPQRFVFKLDSGIFRHNGQTDLRVEPQGKEFASWVKVKGK
jgi:hypothetical protein